MNSENDTDAHICMSIQTETLDEFSKVVTEINETKGMHAWNLTSNEMAKSHLRHLVGGRAQDVSNERLFRLEFPERPGALKEFLYSLGKPTSNNTKSWNVSLFHYRNHGADVGRVLVAFQVDQQDDTAFMAFLNDLGFKYFEETHNPIYEQFLKESFAFSSLHSDTVTVKRIQKSSQFCRFVATNEFEKS